MSGFYFEEFAPVSDDAWRAVLLELDMRRHRKEMAELAANIRDDRAERWVTHDAWRLIHCTERGRALVAAGAAIPAHWRGYFLTGDFG